MIAPGEVRREAATAQSDSLERSGSSEAVPALTGFQRYLGFVLSVEGKMNKAFADCAVWCAKRPRFVQWFVTFLTLLSCVGFLGFYFEKRPEELWALRGSHLIDNMHYMAGTGKQTVRPFVMSMEWDDPTAVDSVDESTLRSKNVLTSTFMDAAREVQLGIMKVTTDKGVKMSDICFKMPPAYRNSTQLITSAPCFVYSALEFWPGAKAFAEDFTKKFTAGAGASCADVPDDLMTSIGQQIGSAAADAARKQANAALGRVAGGLLGALVGQAAQTQTPTLTCGAIASGINMGPGLSWGCQTEMPLSQILQYVDNGKTVSKAEVLKWQKLLPRLMRLPAGRQNVKLSDICPMSCKDKLRCANATVVGQVKPPKLDKVAQAVATCAVGASADMTSKAQTTYAPTLKAGFAQFVEALTTTCNDLPANLISTVSNGVWKDCGALIKLAKPQGGCNADIGASGQKMSALCPFTCRDSTSCTVATRDGNAERTLPLLAINSVLPVVKWDEGQLFGGLKQGLSGAVLSGSAVRSVFLLDCDGDGGEETCEDMERALMSHMGAGDFLPPPLGNLPDMTKNRHKGIKISFFTITGQNDEMLRAMLGALPLFGVSMVLMQGYLVWSLIKTGDEIAHSKVYIGIVGACIVGIATVIGFGICCGMGVMVTPISQVVPFLLLGIGVDDLFIIVRTLERLPTDWSTEKRIRVTYERCGGSIAVTSITDAVAFLVGATIKFPAMQAFCINAGVGVMVNFVLQITFMASTLALTDGVLQGTPTKGDAMFMRLRAKLPFGPTKEDTPDSNTGLTGGHTEGEEGPRKIPIPSNGMRDFIQARLAPYIEHGSDNAHKFGLGVFAFLFALGIYGAPKMVMGFPLTDVFSDDSYVSDFLKSGSRQFNNQFNAFQLVFKTVDYDNPPVIQEMLAVSDQVQASPYVVAKMSRWLPAYINSTVYTGSVSARAAGCTFAQGLPAFLTSPDGMQYSRDIMWEGGAPPTTRAARSADIISAKFNGFFPGDMQESSPLHTATAQEDVVRQMERITDGARVPCFVFCMNMLIWDVWSQLVVQMTFNLGQAFVAILLCCGIFLLHPVTSGIVCLNVLAVEFELMGLCYAFGFQLNTVTVVIFIMNFGLVVDYSAHIAHMFMKTAGTNRYRAAKAVTEMGSGVANGAFTTFVGMAPLIWAPFETGRLFLKLFALIIFLGVLHGFLALPLLLVVLGPAPVGETHDDDFGGDDNLEMFTDELADTVETETTQNTLAAPEGQSASVQDLSTHD